MGRGKNSNRLNGEYLNNLKFADDINLIRESTYELQHMILQLHKECQKVGLKMNIKIIIIEIKTRLRKRACNLL